MRSLRWLAVLVLAGCGGSTRHSPAEVSPAKPTAESVSGASSGCGRALPAQQLATIAGSRSGYTELFVTQTGAALADDQPDKAGNRQFFVRVPADYDKQRPYRVVYVLQGCGSLRSADKLTYPLFDEQRGGTEQAVYVAVSVPDGRTAPSNCYDDTSGATSQEWEAFDLIHGFVESHYCVDNERIFVAGFGSGGWVANMFGCYFGGTPSPPLDDADLAAGLAQRKFAPRWPVRGRAVVSGQLPVNQPLACNGPGAGLWIHDVNDHSDLLQGDINALELALASNGCTGTFQDGPKEPWAPADEIGPLIGTCQRYTGCPADVLERYPLVFCTVEATTHTDHANELIPAFTAFAAALDSQP